MSKWLKKRLKTNIIILVLAIICAVALFYFTENPGFFSASVISLQEAEEMKKNNWDIAYKNDSHVLDVFLSNTLQDVSNITISIIYDPQYAEVNLWDIAIQSNLTTNILSETPWLLVIKIENLTWWFNYQNSLFELPFSSSDNVYNVLLSEASITSIDGENKPLSIGILNNVWKTNH